MAGRFHEETFQLVRLNWHEQTRIDVFNPVLQRIGLPHVIISFTCCNLSSYVRMLPVTDPNRIFGN